MGLDAFSDISLTVAIYDKGFQAQVFFSQAPQLILLLCFMFPLQIGPQTTVNNFDQMEKQRLREYINTDVSKKN